MSEDQASVVWLLAIGSLFDSHSMAPGHPMTTWRILKDQVSVVLLLAIGSPGAILSHLDRLDASKGKLFIAGAAVCKRQVCIIASKTAFRGKSLQSFFLSRYLIFAGVCNVFCERCQGLCWRFQQSLSTPYS